MSLDFYQVKEREGHKKGVIEVYPDYRVSRSQDLMVRGGKFYAIWDPEAELWSTDEYSVQRIIDGDTRDHEVDPDLIAKVQEKTVVEEVHRRYLSNFSSNTWLQFRNYVATLPDSPHWLDEDVTFLNTVVTKSDRRSKRLPYSLASGDISAYDELMSTLYSPEERAKIEWCIGAIITGDSKYIHKALVLYGDPGKGKSTVINIIEWLFEGYTSTFEVSAIVGANNAFALEAFKRNPLVAINHDGDLSKVADNAKLNSIIAHENMTINEKHKSQYDARVNAMLVIGTNKPVKITDAKSGLIRRILDAHPTGVTLSPRRYRKIMDQILFELGAIAWHCSQVYQDMGKDYYADYIPIDMMMKTDVFFNYIEAHYDVFESQNGTSLKQAFDMWKVWLDETATKWDMPQYKFREELKNYFDTYEERTWIDGVRVRNWYGEFNAMRFKTPTPREDKDNRTFSLILDEDISLLDDVLANYPAQYSVPDGEHLKFWTNKERTDRHGKPYIPSPGRVVQTSLRDLDTHKEHYCKVPEDHIVIDFDLTDSFGNKSLERNLEAAASWPATYAEISTSGGGVHLHYRWTGGTPELLSRVYAPGIEVKVYTGDSSLRRRLTRCNDIPVADLSSRLSFKEGPVYNPETVMNEVALRKLIQKNLRKEVHAATKPSVDFIRHILDEAYASGEPYDVTDMRPAIMAFANSSSHQANEALLQVSLMQFKSEERDDEGAVVMPETEKPVIFDVEVFPNLFVVCWKYSGSSEVVRLVNPTSHQIEDLLALKLVGFNNKKYDNHMLYARLIGFNNAELYEASKMIIDGSPNAYFREAYNLSYTDIFDFSAKKQSLKKWEIELGLHHLELGLPWDEPVPEELWDKVVEYCVNDVEGTDGVFQHLQADFIARQILADISGLSVNSSTQQHTARIVFGTDRNPQNKFKYTNLADDFPGYEYKYNETSKRMVSTYKGEELGEGGLVRAKPGMYTNVFLFDIASMHPTSIEALNLFGEYTENFVAIMQARLAIKRGDYEAARQMFGGKLAPYLTNEELAEALSYALKIVINIVYGLTAAGFDNAFRDPRNIDNIVAKRGALFMLDLMLEVEARGFNVIHIKTDSIKIPDATPEIIEFLHEFAKKWGYTFEHEKTYSKMVLVNDAVYAAKIGWAPKKEKIGTWEAVGAQFIHPYVYKYLFSREEITFKDMCETKNVQTAIYLDFEGEDVAMAFSEDKKQFVGKTGLFTPILEGRGGGLLVRQTNKVTSDGKPVYDAVTGTKGWRWLEAETVETLGKQKDIDGSYFENLVNKAIDNISQYGDFEWFVS